VSRSVNRVYMTASRPKLPPVMGGCQSLSINATTSCRPLTLCQR